MSFDPLLLTVQPMKQIKRKEKVIFKRSRKQKSNKSELDWNHQNSNQEFRRCKYFAAFQKKTSNHKILDAVKTKDLFASSLNRRDCHHLWRHEISEPVAKHMNLTPVLEHLKYPVYQKLRPIRVSVIAKTMRFQMTWIFFLHQSESRYLETTERLDFALFPFSAQCSLRIT